MLAYMAVSHHPGHVVPLLTARKARVADQRYFRGDVAAGGAEGRNAVQALLRLLQGKASPTSCKCYLVAC